jgi:HEAT repeat protein
MARLLDNDGGVQRVNEAAALELEKMAPPIETLLPLFEDPEANVRRGVAFHVLAAFDPHNEEQVAAFLALLDDGDPTVRGFGVAAVRQMRPQDQTAAVPALMALLSPDREVKPESRAAIARLLGSFRAEGSRSLDRLAQAARDDPDGTVRAAALSALPQVAEPQQAAALVASGLADPEARVRIVAVTRLRQLGAEAAPAAKELAAALADDDPRIREAAAAAIINIGEPATRPLAEQLGGKSIEARKLALACLAKIGPAAKEALPAVEKCHSDADPLVRELAAVAIERIAAK